MCIYIGTASLSYTLTVLILFLLIIIIIIILLLLLPSLLVSQFILTWCNEPHGYSCINHVSIIDKTIDWLIYEHQIWVCKLFTPIETNSVYPKIVYSDISSSADCGKKKWFWPIASNRLSQVPHGALLVQTCSQSSKLHKVEQARFSSNTKTLLWNQYSVWNLKPCDLQQLVLLLLLLQCLHCFQFGLWSSGCWLLLCCWEKSPRVDVCDPEP